ncbi:MAG: hypothetical protein H6876_01340 [Hyphomicrobiaceae bacterium]|nr:hypothetical protein [Hyphomicrobiaceae bacterium]
MKPANTIRKTLGKDRLVGLFCLCRETLFRFQIDQQRKGPKLTFPDMVLGRWRLVSGAFSYLALIVIPFALPISTSHAAFIEVDQDIVFTTSCRVALEGEIKQGDFEKFAETILQGWGLGCSHYSIVLSSNGGNVVEAIKIGRLVRELAAHTWAPSNTPGRTSCSNYRFKPRGGCVCFSACSLIWAAGVQRGGDYVYMHRPYFKKQLDDPFSRQSIQAYRSAFDLTRDYLHEMNVPEMVIEKMLATSSVKGARLDRRELQMMEVDPIYEELILRECGSNSKKIRTVHTECKLAFQSKHSRRLRANAETYIKKFKGSSPQSPR